MFCKNNCQADHPGEAFHIVDAMTRHGKLFWVVAQASEVQEHLQTIVNIDIDIIIVNIDINIDIEIGCTSE